MAISTNDTSVDLIKWQRKVRTDYIRGDRFDAYTSESGGIWTQVPDLSADGKEIRIPLHTQLTGNGVGTGTLTGNEEQMNVYGFPMWAAWHRNAIRWDKGIAKEASFAVKETARMAVRNWSKRKVRDDKVKALLSVPTASEQANRDAGNAVNGVKWADATTAQKNTWTAANSDRVLFGAAKANYNATFATAVANVDGTTDVMSTGIVDLAKEIAQSTGYTDGSANGRPIINPWMIENTDEEYFVLFVGSRAMRDLRADTAMAAANREAREREADPKKNPIFTGGALMWNGVIIREIPEITTHLLLSGVGASNIDVEPFFFCGMNAYGHAVGQMPILTEPDITDHQFIQATGVQAQHGVGKIAASVSGSLVDWGVVTGFVAGVASA